MSFFSSIKDAAKKVIKATNPMTWSVGGISAATVASQAASSYLPAPVASFAQPIIQAGAAKLFGSSTVSLGAPSPVAPPGGMSLVSGRNAAAATRRAATVAKKATGVFGKMATNINLSGWGSSATQQALQTNILRARAATNTPALAPVNRAALTRNVSAYPSGDQIYTPPGGQPAVVGAKGVPAMSRLPALVGVVRSLTGKIIRIVTPEGRSINRKGVVSFVKKFGAEAAAAALGVTVADVLQAVMDESTTRRRRRGITPRDLQTTRRTICKIKSMNKLVTSSAPRRRTCK